jgi:hypothetical protein
VAKVQGDRDILGMRAAAVQQPQGQPRRRRGDLLTDLSELKVAAEYLWRA